jgi:hypothetical protein
MSLDSIQDSYFGCAESPVHIPENYKLSQIPPYKSATLRLVSQIAGPGTITPRADGLGVDENPTASFSMNGVQYNLRECVLMLGGAHRLAGRPSPCVAELAVYFTSVDDGRTSVCLCLPIDVGVGAANKYFATLGESTFKGRPTLGSIVPASAQFLVYRGADLRGRTASSSQPRSFCDPVRTITTYYVCMTPILMAAPDYQRLKTRAGKGLVGPPKPLAPLPQSRITQLCSLVNGIALVAAPPLKGAVGAVGAVGSATPGDPGIPTAAMKCYRLNPDRDIVNGKIYVGGKGVPFNPGSDSDIDIAGDEPTIKPGDIQRWIGIIIGVVVGILLCAFIAVKLYGTTFTNYFGVQNLYKSPVSAAALTSAFPTIKLPTICPEPTAAATAVAAAKAAATATTA